MRKSIIYLCACALSGMMVTASCQDSQDLDATASDTRSVNIDKDLFAVKGCINVKLAKGTNQAIPTTRSGSVEMQSVPSAMTSAMQYSGAYKMERVFKPAGIYEARTVAEGLDRWYTIYFDKSKDVAAVLDQFKKADGVECAERVLPMARPTVKMTPYSPSETSTQGGASNFDDPLLAKQWHYYNDGTISAHAKRGADCNVKPVWEKYTTGKKNVIVAVVDGGIDITHEDLKDNLYVNEKEKNGQPNVDDDGNGFVDDIYGYNFVTAKDVVGGTIEPDDGGHGTHVAGTVAARNNNGKGVAGIAGGDGSADSGVRLLSCQIFRNKDEQGDAAAAIKYAADNGAVICQNSWGYSSTAGVTSMPQLLKEAIDYFIKMAGCDANGNQRPDSPMKGGVVMFAAGNENKEFSAYPACYAPTVSVAAMAWDFSKASYSNYAKWVTITAPGGDQDRFGTSAGVLSTVPKKKVASGYAYFQGTSMACPHVSGIAALIASYFGRQGFTNEELKTRLTTAYRPYNIDEQNPTYKGKLGKGYIDAEAAFETDTKIAPEKVGTLTLKPDFVDINAEWSIAKDEDKTAAFYRLYIAQGDLTADKLKDMTYREINGMGHSLGETLKYDFDDLKDNTTYSVAVVAVDRWGNLSEPMIQKCTTRLNHAPEATGFPTEAIEVMENDRKSFSFNVADPDGHNWDIAAAGVFCAVAHGTELNFGRTGGDSDDHSYAGCEEMSAGAHHVDQAAHHLFASVEVGNHAVLQRTDHADLFARLFIHELGAFADCDGLIRTGIEGNDRRFVDGDLTVGDNDGVGRAQIHGQLAFHREEGRKNSHWAMRWLEGGAMGRIACGKILPSGVRPVRTRREWPCRSARRWRKRGWQRRDAPRAWFLRHGLRRFRAAGRSQPWRKRSPRR